MLSPNRAHCPWAAHAPLLSTQLDWEVQHASVSSLLVLHSPFADWSLQVLANSSSSSPQQLLGDSVPPIFQTNCPSVSVQLLSVQKSSSSSGSRHSTSLLQNDFEPVSPKEWQLFVDLHAPLLSTQLDVEQHWARLSSAPQSPFSDLSWIAHCWVVSLGSFPQHLSSSPGLSMYVAEGKVSHTASVSSPLCQIFSWQSALGPVWSRLAAKALLFTQVGFPGPLRCTHPSVSWQHVVIAESAVHPSNPAVHCLVIWKVIGSVLQGSPAAAVRRGSVRVASVATNRSCATLISCLAGLFLFVVRVLRGCTR